MVIDYEKYPILKSLKNGKLSGVPAFVNEDKPFFMSNNYLIYENNFNTNIPAFTKNIYIFSKNFITAVMESYDKLLPLWSDMIKNNEELSIQGTFILKNTVRLINYNIGKSEYQNAKYYEFVLGRFPSCCYVSEFENPLTNISWVSNKAGCSEPTNDFVNKKMATCVLIGLFIKYAQVETKTIFTKRKIKDSEGNHINYTDSNVIKLDCKWFTDIVSSDSFNVRGHFRLQPCKKNGEWTKELIWINEFQKTGYTSLAKKDKP